MIESSNWLCCLAWIPPVHNLEQGTSLTFNMKAATRVSLVFVAVTLSYYYLTQRVYDQEFFEVGSSAVALSFSPPGHKMIIQTIITIVFQLALLSFSVQAKPLQKLARVTRSLDSFLAAESPYALQGVLDNIGPDGAAAKGVAAGIVTASPSSRDPDCESDSRLDFSCFSCRKMHFR